VPVGHNDDGSTKLADVPAVGDAGGVALQNFLDITDTVGPSGTGHQLVAGSCTMDLAALDYTSATNKRDGTNNAAVLP
jgi:hypothetical protein